MNRQDSQHLGFTLIELLAVLTLLALLTAFVSVSMGTAINSANKLKLIQIITDYDRDTRELAHRLDRPLRLTVSIDHQSITRSHIDAEDDKHAGVPLKLPHNWKLQTVLTADTELRGNAIDLYCTQHGATHTYALQLHDKNNGSLWLLVAGLSGQVSEINDEQTIRNIFKQLQRHDAH